MKAVYPIILTPAERGYVVFVPDLDINTEGEDLADAIEMAPGRHWSLGHYGRGRRAEDSTGIRHHAPPGRTGDRDAGGYRLCRHTAVPMTWRTVRKNVTLPSWLNDLAERNGVNFSQVLQESLKERLHVSNR